MDFDLSVIENDFEAFKSQIEVQTQNSLQIILQRILSAEFTYERLTGVECVLCELIKREEILEICEDTIRHLWKNVIIAEYHESVASYLLQCIDLIEAWKRERLAHHIIQSLHEECVSERIIFEVLAYLMSRLEEAKDVSNSIVDRLCASSWNSSNLNALLSALSNRNIQPTSMVPIIKKAFECIKNSVLSSDDRAISFCILLRLEDLNLVGMVIAKLSRLFEEMRPVSVEESADLLGKIILHLMSIFKTQDFMVDKIARTLKTLPVSSVLEMFPFVLAALVISGESKYAQQLTKHLCNATTYIYSSNDRISGAAFLRKVYLPLTEPEATADLILTNCSSNVWNCVVKGLVHYCFGLLKSSSVALARFGCGSSADGGHLGQKRCPAAKSQRALTVRQSVQHQQSHDFSSTLPPKARISRLALNVLTETFQTLTDSRESIVATALNQIWLEPGKTMCFQMTELLGELAALCPVELAKTAHEPLTRLLECLGSFTLEISTALLHSLLPLLVVSVPSVNSANDDGALNKNTSMDCLVSLQSRVILTLRKMATTYSVPVRRIAVAGFITLLKNFQVRSSTFRTASQLSWSTSTQLSAGSQSWPSSLTSFSQMPAPGGFPLFSQITNTQVAQAVTMLPTDPLRNEALCTEIVGLLHRLIHSTFFGNNSSPLFNDPAALVKSDIYWGLCEVAVTNRGLVGPVLTLFTRLLSTCIDPALAKWRPVLKNGVFGLPQIFTGVPLKLSQLISADTGPDCKLSFRDHPAVLVWCLQVLLSLPLFHNHWSRFALTFTEGGIDTSSVSSASSQFTQSSSSLLTQSTLTCCSSGLSMRVFTRAASLLLNFVSGMRETSLDEFGLTSDVELGSTAVGLANRARLTMLLGLYDACLEFEAKNLLSAVTDANSSWSNLKRLFARRESTRKLLFHLSEEETQDTSTVPVPIVATTEISTNLCFVGTSEGRLRGALLLSGLQSIVGSLPRVLISAFTAPAFALHLLQTACTRLYELTRTAGASGCSGSKSAHQPLLSVVYRTAFVRIVAKILRLTIRFYATHLEGVENRAQISTISEATSTAALQTIALCFTAVMEGLGSRHLMRLVCAVHSVAAAPKPLLEDDVDGKEVDGEALSEINGSRVESSSAKVQNSSQQAISRALTAVVKLFKGWVTRILAVTSSSLSTSTQHSIEKPTKSTHGNALLTDLTILLPMLIRLCEARTTILSTASVSSSIVSSPLPDFSGLDRVLIWLLRLLCTKEEALENKAGYYVAAQAVRLALQLAYLLGSTSASASRNSASVTHRRSSTGTASLADLTWDDLVVLLAADVRCILGNIESDLSESIHETPLSSQSSSHSVCGGTSKTVTFPVVNSKSAANSILQVLILVLNQALEDVVWIVESVAQEVQQSILENGCFAMPKSTIGGSNSIPFASLPDARRAREMTVCDMLLTLGEALDELLQTSMQPSHAYDVIRLATGLFDLLAKLTKHYTSLVQRSIGTFPTTFERVVRLYGRQVSPHAYSLVYFLQIREAGKDDVKPTKKAKVDSTFTKPKNLAPSRQMISRNLKDAKLIPQLIFAIEQYESLLANLSKKSKVTLIDNIRMGLSRDFRINQASALASLEAEAEVTIDGHLELPPLSDSESQQRDEIGDSIGTNNGNYDGDVDGAENRTSIIERKRSTFCVKFHSRE